MTAGRQIGYVLCVGPEIIWRLIVRSGGQGILHWFDQDFQHSQWWRTQDPSVREPYFLPNSMSSIRHREEQEVAGEAKLTIWSKRKLGCQTKWKQDVVFDTQNKNPEDVTHDCYPHHIVSWVGNLSLSFSFCHTIIINPTLFRVSLHPYWNCENKICEVGRL